MESIHLNNISLQDIRSLLDSRFGDLQVYLGSQMRDIGDRITALENGKGETVANKIRLLDLERRLALLEAAVPKSREAIVVTSIAKWLAMTGVGALIIFIIKGT